MTLQIIEVARVIPAVDLAFDSCKSLAIPLTFFDLLFLRFIPVHHVFFYRPVEAESRTREHFHSFIVPKLKLSLSLVLRNYLPLTGRITWDPNNPKPSITVSENDAVLTTIAETDADFSLLSGYGHRPVSDLHALFSKLPVSNDSATILSVQITLFPNAGFSIGFSIHHAALDGKTVSMFVKAWAHICKGQIDQNVISISLPENLTPSYDRSLLKDPTGIERHVIEVQRFLQEDKTSTSLTPFPAREIGDDVVLATFVLSYLDIEQLREGIRSQENLHLSTFVIAYAYVWTCLVKARGGSGERSVTLLLIGDFRERLDPPLPSTYFGNCVSTVGSFGHKAKEFADEKGFKNAVQIHSDLVKALSSRKIETIVRERMDRSVSIKESSQVGWAAGSTRMGVYESDFGWGRPVKVDLVSIDQGEAISMTERRDGSGGVEIGMCLKKIEMDIFFSLLHNGLQHY